MVRQANWQASRSRPALRHLDPHAGNRHLARTLARDRRPFGDAGKRLLERAAAPDIGNVACRAAWSGRYFARRIRCRHPPPGPRLAGLCWTRTPATTLEGTARTLDWLKSCSAKPEAYYAPFILLDGDSMGVRSAPTCVFGRHAANLPPADRRADESAFHPARAPAYLDAPTGCLAELPHGDLERVTALRFISPRTLSRTAARGCSSTPAAMT